MKTFRSFAEAFGAMNIVSSRRCMEVENVQPVKTEGAMTKINRLKLYKMFTNENGECDFVQKPVPTSVKIEMVFLPWEDWNTYLAEYYEGVFHNCFYSMGNDLVLDPIDFVKAIKEARKNGAEFRIFWDGDKLASYVKDKYVSFHLE